jgi:hypothetical protein
MSQRNDRPSPSSEATSRLSLGDALTIVARRHRSSFDRLRMTTA